ncbi:acyltransferase family protein [Sphaerisporangium sp. TRM90804]|uniref:acyltransferase family protein n=1 Tax=Sphaerisporangium sp. TRM90804 TaxID=3031113 RepID=UPI00244875EF|nr:acyltransferase family protein [Sphaerisporangium sp. TRM90804]MDH2427814.1 acyltransferase family protein [Sphaerisporangium sp. TRM90804]
MSDTRSSFHVPAPRSDDVPDEESGAAEEEQAPESAATDTETGPEEAPAARWPVPDYAAPPTGAWDRHRPRTAERSPGSLWPAADPTQHVTHDHPAPRHRSKSAPAPADDDPETFTFDAPRWDDRQPQGYDEAPPRRPSPGEAAPRRPSTDEAAPRWPSPGEAAPRWPSADEETPPAPYTPLAGQAVPHAEPYADDPTPYAGRSAAHAVAPSVPAWGGGHATRPAEGAVAPEQAPPGVASDGFSYWERRPPQPAPSTQGGWPDTESPRGGVQTGERAWGQPWPQPEEAPEAQAAPAAKRPREPYLDNVKFVLIALVVTGHSLVPTLAADSSRAAYLFIYVFHMPLFVVISGYLSRNFWNSNAKTNKLVDTFLVPYVIVELGYAVLRFAFGHKWSLTIIDPAWLNWYLLALLLWRLSTPVWRRMRYPLPIAVAVYLLAGLSDLPGDFSMDRFFGLMPFFVLGLLLQPHHFDLLNRAWIKILSVGVLAGAAAVAILIAPEVPLDPIYYKDAYAELKLSWWMGMGVRLGLLVAALAVSMAVMALVPRRSTWFSDLGTRTLYCYLLHGVPVYIAKEMGWLSQPWLYGPLGVMAITSSCFALAIVLCLPETRTAFKWLLEPRLSWLYRRPSS